MNEWIDLIFGFKQKGPEAEKAFNSIFFLEISLNFLLVFYHLSYEGAVDIDTIQDPTEKQAVIDHIQNFGQVRKLKLSFIYLVDPSSTLYQTPSKEKCNRQRKSITQPISYSKLLLNFH